MRRVASILCAAFLLIGVSHARAATSISACGTVITQPGSYLVTKSLMIAKAGSKDCIVVAADDVTIDLGGSTIDCVSQVVDGINDRGIPHSGLIIRNGSIVRCWEGVSLLDSKGVLVEGMLATASFADAISVGEGGLVIDCVINDNNFIGIDLVCPTNAIDNTALGNIHNISIFSGSDCGFFNNLAP
jgi:hypothetical protein